MFLSFFIFIFSFIQIISKTNYGYKEIISDLFREEKKIARNKTIINLIFSLLIFSYCSFRFGENSCRIGAIFSIFILISMHVISFILTAIAISDFSKVYESSKKRISNNYWIFRIDCFLMALLSVKFCFIITYIYISFYEDYSSESWWFIDFNNWMTSNSMKKVNECMENNCCECCFSDKIKEIKKIKFLNMEKKINELKEKIYKLNKYFNDFENQNGDINRDSKSELDRIFEDQNISNNLIDSDNNNLALLESERKKLIDNYQTMANNNEELKKEIENLEEEKKINEQEIKNIKDSMKLVLDNNKNNNKTIEEIEVQFNSVDQTIKDEKISCKKNELFIDVEKKIYEKYKNKGYNINNFFFGNGDVIHKFKSIVENKIQKESNLLINFLPETDEQTKNNN